MGYESCCFGRQVSVWSFTFRGLDLALCASFPQGTHCLRYLLNGLVWVLYPLSVLPALGPCQRNLQLR